jgi:Flp pilus assembly protein TadD
MRRYVSLLFVAPLLALVTFVAYGSVGANEFVNIDDDLYVTNNRHVQGGVTATDLRWAWTAEEGFWHPLTWMSLQLDAQWFGPSPVGFHRTNLLLHVINVLLLLWTLWYMTEAVWRSALVASVFAVHPLNVETVAWVAERKGLLSSVFWFATLLAYAFYSKRPGIARYLLVITTLTFGLLSKPMLVTLPCVLLLLDYWPLRRSAVDVSAGESAADGSTSWRTIPFTRLLLEKAPLFALAVAVAVATFHAEQRIGAVSTTAGPLVEQRIANAIVSYVRYLGAMVWPTGLAPFYPHPGGALSPWKVGAAAVLLLGTTIVAVLTKRRRPYLIVGWLWYLGTLVPVIGLVQIGSHGWADRYAYIPLIGIFLAISWLLTDIATDTVVRRVLVVVSGAVVAACLVCTWSQVRYWHDSVQLWRHTVLVNPDNALAHYNLARALLDRNQAQEAIPHLRKTVAVDPNYWEAHYGLGVLALGANRPQEAVSSLEAATRINPDYAPAQFRLGLSLAALGDLDRAAEHYMKALRTDPNNAEICFHLGQAQARRQKWKEAAASFERAAHIDPRAPVLRRCLAEALEKDGQKEAAAVQYQEASRLEGKR